MNSKNSIFFSIIVSIASNITFLRSELPSGVTLCAVSKFHPASAIGEAYAAGQRVFGESRPQEMAAKAAELPLDIQWHFIGHLQTNKVAAIAPFVALIHSVDSVRLLDEISRVAVKIGRTIRVLLEVHIASEDSKQGFSPDEVRAILNGDAPLGTEIVGLMGMATYTDNMEQVTREFAALKRLFDEFSHLTVLSMGMSGDWQTAVRQGSNMVRIGTAIFSDRNN